MRTLVLYDNNSTYTNAVYDHLKGFSKYGFGETWFCDCNVALTSQPLAYFHNVVIHYSARVAHEKITEKFIKTLNSYNGLKVLFLQDEYENTNTAISFIVDSGMDVVYTCVPKKFIKTIYGNKLLKNVKFINNLTGYVVNTELNDDVQKIVQRPIEIGYRGRELPHWYGDLGQEKTIIAKVVRQHCERVGIVSDIEFDDSKRIYGKNWNKFLGDCRVVLGAESGCNLFDCDGTLKQSWLSYLQDFPEASYARSRQAILGSIGEKPIMNQISPRVFEAISAKTALMMFVGDYSGVLRKDYHYIALEKDFSNLEQCLEKVKDTEFLQSMVDRAFKDVILNPKYHEKTFFEGFYKVLATNQKHCETSQKKGVFWALFGFTSAPVHPTGGHLRACLKVVWKFLPEFVKHRVRPTALFILYRFACSANKRP